MYEKVAKNIAPKRESLSKAEVDHQESQEQLNRKKQQLREAQEKLKSVHDDMQVMQYNNKLNAALVNEIRCQMILNNNSYLLLQYYRYMQLKKQKKAELENEVELCSRKLERAEQLITGKISQKFIHIQYYHFSICYSK